MPAARVLVLGDSHRLAYRGELARVLSVDGLTVVGPEESTGGARSLAESVGDLIARFEPDVACFACGPHAAEETVAAAQAEPERGMLGDYEADLERIAQALVRFCGRQVLYSTVVPVHTERLARTLGRGADAEDAARLLQRRLDQCNQLATDAMGRLNVMVADPARDVARYVDEVIAEDGFSLTDSGVERVARSVSLGVYGVL